MKLALFYVWEDAKSGLIKIIPLICTSATRTSILCFLILSLLRVHHWGWLQQLTAGWLAFFVSILSSLRAHCWSSCNMVA